MESNQLHWVDTHCHLYVAEFDEDRSAMIARALQNGVTSMMLPNIDRDSIEPMKKLVEQFPGNCFPMMGLHPCSVSKHFETELSFIKQELMGGAYFGIGETGIDLYWDTTCREEQIEVFEQHIDWAKSLELPIVIHSRESLDLNIDLIRKHQDGRLSGIFHCFGGTVEQAMSIYELGFKIGIGGVVTYKNSDLANVIRQVPVDILVLETDAPYLSPVPYRGKRNESAYVPVIAARLADALQLSLGELATLTTNNASAVFKKNL